MKRNTAPVVHRPLPVVHREGGSRMPISTRKLVAWIFLLFLGMNLIGCLFGFIGPVRVIAAPLALQLGATYGVVSGLLIGGCMYYVLKRAPILPAVSRSIDWLRRWPSIWALSMAILFGGFGFVAVAHTGAWVYSDAFGARTSRIVTVSESYLAKRRHCYVHSFADVSPFTSSIRLLCIDRRLSAGTRVRFDGLESVLGLAVIGVYVGNDA